jgi:hypothetical protein
MYLRNVILAALVSAAAASAQYSPFMSRYAFPTDPVGELYVNITNTGAFGAPLLGPGFGAAAGNICVNVYAFDPGEELVSCCSCLVTPDQTVSLGVNRDLLAKTLTGVIPPSVTIKLLSTLAGGDGTGSSCTNSAASVTTATLGTGSMAAWGTSLQTTPVAGTYATTETAFTPATLGSAELASIGGRCAAILGNGSGFGICNSCRAGALGATKLSQ